MPFEYEYIFSAENLREEITIIISDIDLNYFPTPWKKEDWEKLFSTSDRFLALVYDSHKVIGLALFDLNIVDSFAHLLKIIIVPSYQKQGVGRELLSNCLKVLAIKKMISHYFLEVEVTNNSAIKLYEKSSFKIIHQKKHFYGTGRDAFVMTLEIAN